MPKGDRGMTRIFRKDRSRRYMELGSSNVFRLYDLGKVIEESDIATITQVPNKEDVLLPTLITIIQDRESIISEDVSLLNRVIRNGGFTTYIRRLENE
jgi:polyhydroxyalkanoate synthesis regulator protein